MAPSALTVFFSHIVRSAALKESFSPEPPHPSSADLLPGRAARPDHLPYFRSSGGGSLIKARYNSKS